MEKKVLIVDDEERILQSITGVLEDEGFQVRTARSGEEAIGIFQQEGPDVTLLDIWMPGMDGIEVLKRFKWIAPDCQVIMISGHATISTAMTAVKLGAFDFIEKPLSLDILLMTIRRALDRKKELLSLRRSEEIAIEENPLQVKVISKEMTGETIVHPLITLPETAPPLQGTLKRRGSSLSLQRTLKQSMVLYGTGLHSGMKTGLLLQPLPPNSGILFGNISSDEVVPAHLDYVQTTEFATSLKKGRAVARTIEHLMAVLHAYRITNLMVKMIEEIPIMDGSALEFCKIVEEAGVEEQEERIDELIIDRKLEVVRRNKFLVIEPADLFSVRYFLDYPPPIGQQALTFVLESEEAFRDQIAPARTFGFLKDIEMLEKMGMGEGGRLHNFILVDDEKIVNTELRFPDEFVRHKVLDLIGDFYLLNRPVRGKVTAHLTGHTEDIALLKKIQEAIREKKGEDQMAQEEYRPQIKEFLDMLADLLAEKYFERMDDRIKKIPELRRLITAKEASQYLSLSTDTVYRMASLKKLPYLKIGDRVLFDVKALDQWIEKHMVKEKEWKRQELEAEFANEKSNTKPSRESDLLGLLKKKGKD